jgi:septum formation protein
MTSTQIPPKLILASTSRYRRELLTRLRVPFDVVSPEVDEAALIAEAPHSLALRLALAKASVVAAAHPEAFVIGSDQVVDLNGVGVSKPGMHEAAAEQLRQMSGQALVFHTAVALVAPRFSQVRNVQIKVQFKQLNSTLIERYLRLEQPYDCAGSAKSEGLGISLLKSVESSDPTALIGLPLITVCSLLEEAGYALWEHTT